MSKTFGFTSVDSLPAKQLTDRITGRIASCNQGMVIWWTMKAGAHVGAHKHDNEQIAWLIRGRMEFRLGDELRTCGPGDVVVIPAGVEHEASFPEDTEVIDVFTPPRQDFLADGPPAYMKDDA